MGTAKRERQKANKAQREQELARQAARSRTTRIGLIVAGAVVAVFVLVFVAARFTGSDDPATDDSLATSDAVAPADSVETGTLPAVDAEPAVTADCPPEEGAAEQTQDFASTPPMCLDPAATYTALVSTTAGDITVELDPAAAPETVNNFVFLARNNYFDDTVCHRVIQDFVVQCGDPTATGTGGPGYEFADELPAAGGYQIGSLAMANSGPDTNGSQFFIISGPDGAQLPPQYSLFGQTIESDLGVVADMNALGSTDQSGVSSEEIRITDVTITQS